MKEGLLPLRLQCLILELAMPPEPDMGALVIVISFVVLKANQPQPPIEIALAAATGRLPNPALPICRCYRL